MLSSPYFLKIISRPTDNGNLCVPTTRCCWDFTSSALGALFQYLATVWITRGTNDSTTRKQQVGQSQSTCSRLLPTKHMLPHTNYTQHMVFLFSQVTGPDWSCPVDSDTWLGKWNKNLTFLASRYT